MQKFNYNFPFRDIRQSSLDYWLKETGRERISDNEFFVGAAECRWQFRFQEDQDGDNHYSIFCSMGDWNSNMGDLLDDKRYDGLTYHPTNASVLFRYYTRILLVTSEILTDFQDILTVFRNGNVDAVKWRQETDKSRIELNPPGNFDVIQNMFDYINTVCKHKTRNFHACNHHIKYFFEDSGETHPLEDFINIHNVTNVLDSFRNQNAQSSPKKIIVPKLQGILKILLHGYETLNDTFQKDPAKFEAFCKIYEGKSISNLDDDNIPGIVAFVFPS